MQNRATDPPCEGNIKKCPAGPVLIVRTLAAFDLLTSKNSSLVASQLPNPSCNTSKQNMQKEGGQHSLETKAVPKRQIICPYCPHITYSSIILRG